MDYDSERRRLRRLLRADHQAYLDKLDKPWSEMSDDLDVAVRIVLSTPRRPAAGFRSSRPAISPNVSTAAAGACQLRRELAHRPAATRGTLRGTARVYGTPPRGAAALTTDDAAAGGCLRQGPGGAARHLSIRSWIT